MATTFLPLFDTQWAAYAEVSPTKQERSTQRDESKRALAFVCQQIGRSFRTDDLHAWFGTAFCTRGSELNHSECPITIRNHTEHLPDGREGRYYWAERRSPRHRQQPTVAAIGTFPEFDDLAPGSWYPD